LCIIYMNFSFPNTLLTLTQYTSFFHFTIPVNEICIVELLVHVPLQYVERQKTRQFTVNIHWPAWCMLMHIIFRILL